MKKIVEAYRAAARKNKKVAAFWAKIRDGTVKYADAYSYADITSGIAMEQMLAYDGLTLEDITNALVANGEDVLGAASSIQAVYNHLAKVGLKSVELSPNLDRIAGLVKHIEDRNGALEEVDREAVRNLARANVDETISKNAEFQYKSGFEVTVTREYDGVGLKEGRCKWCLDRCGDNVPYPKALAMGMFERHEGCGCIIEYTSRKGTQRQTNWERNRWEAVPSDIQRRRQEGL